MLPPVQTSPRSVLAFAESATETTALSATPNGGAQDQPTHDQIARADQNSNTNTTSVAGQINNLLLNSRDSVRMDMATIADMVGSSINIKRTPGESDGAFAARFVTALAHLSDSQRAALQTQLNQVLKGLQVQALLQVLQNQDGPEAALLSAYMEIQRSNRDNLKAQTVVQSYSQNADSAPEEQSGQASLNTPRSNTAAQPGAPVTQQSSITIALQASIVGAKDKEEAIAKLAAALKQALPNGTVDYAAETGPLNAPSALPVAEDETTTTRNTPAAATTTTDADAKTAKAVGQDVAQASPGAKPAPDVSARPANVVQNPTLAAQTATSTPNASPAASGATDKPITQQSMPQQTAVLATSSSLLDAEIITPAQISAATVLSAEEASAQTVNTQTVRHTETAGAVVPTPVSTPSQSAQNIDLEISKEVIVATALAANGVTDPASLLTPAQKNTQQQTDTALLRQMFFQSNEPNEAAEITAFRALANRPDTTENTGAAYANEPDQQTAEKAATRTQTALSLAGAQVVPTPPNPSQVSLPLAVPVLIGSYLAMQDPPTSSTRNVSVDAIDALSDEAPHRDNKQQNQKHDQPAEGETPDENEIAEDGVYAMTDGLDTSVEEEPDAAYAFGSGQRKAPETAALPAPQDGPVAADMLYWKIADLA